MSLIPYGHNHLAVWRSALSSGNLSPGIREDRHPPPPIVGGSGPHAIKRAMALLEWLIVAAAAFGGLVALMYVAQRSQLKVTKNASSIEHGRQGQDQVQDRGH